MPAQQQLDTVVIARRLTREVRDMLFDRFGGNPGMSRYEIRVREAVVRSVHENALQRSTKAAVIIRRLDSPKGMEQKSWTFIAAGLCDHETGELEIMTDKMEGVRGLNDLEAWTARLISILDMNLARNTR